MNEELRTAVRGALQAISVSLLGATCLVLSGWLLREYRLSLPLRIAIALLPAPAYAVYLLGFMRYTQGHDELGWRIHLETLGLAFPLTAFALLLYGLLDFAGVVSQVSWVFAWMAMTALWIGSYAVTAWRYR